MSDMVKVTRLEQTFSHRKTGKTYGPFTPSAEKPYLEVPLSIALARGASLHEGEADTAQAPAAPPADLTEAQARIKTLEAEKAEWEKQRDGLLADLAASLKREDALKARLSEGEAPADAPQPEQSPPTDLPQPPADDTPLPEGILHRDLLMEGGFDTLEKLAAGLVVAEGQTESPVRQLEGVGAKTEDAYKALVAEWKAGRK